MSKQEEIKQALAAATPGPWIAKDDSVAAGNDWICQMYEGDPDCECDFNEFPNAEMNAGFIAMAPEYIAYLLEENERLRKELEEAQRGKDIMSNYLNELMQSTSNVVVASQIYNVLREAVGREEFDPVGQEGEGNQCK